MAIKTHLLSSHHEIREPVVATGIKYYLPAPNPRGVKERCHTQTERRDGGTKKAADEEKGKVRADATVFPKDGCG